MDETYFGGKQKNKPARERRKNNRQGVHTMTATVGMKDRVVNEVRTKVVSNKSGPTLQGFVRDYAVPGAVLYTDEAKVYRKLGGEFIHEVVDHSVGQYVRGQAHINGMESFWAVLKRAHKGIYHKISPKHLHRYAGDFAGRHALRSLDTINMLKALTAGMAGKRLCYRALIADNGLPSGIRG